MFSGRVNPVTGRHEWVAEDRDAESEEGDLSRELARSQYGDMLHDTARNKLYRQAIEKAVAAMKACGREPHVLDIGTGTGLLSMMAARAGATKVTAVEVLKPMVRISREVIAINGYSDVITVVPKRSTDMTERDMERGRANILVTEVFDTELIGEGALLTYSHAVKNLMEPECIVIPETATVYVQLVQSEFLWQHHKLFPERVPGGFSVPAEWEECCGAPSLWDLHAEQLKIPQQMNTLSRPTQIAKFALGAPSYHSLPVVEVTMSESGECHGVLMWWTADMSGIELSMSPWQYTQWRDHWLQAIQLLPNSIHVKKGEKLSVRLEHDDYSMWFRVNSPCPGSSLSSPPPLPSSPERPICTCGVHTAWSRSRIAMLNDTTRTELYLKAMTQALPGVSKAVCISDGSLLPLLLTRSNLLPSLSTVYSLQHNEHSATVYKRLIDCNPLPDGKELHILTKSPHEIKLNNLVNEATPTGCAPIGAVIGEPYFSTSLLPWHDLHFWYAQEALRELCTPECVVVPCSASLMAIAVSFQDLYSLRAPVRNVEGFDISVFDKQVGKVNCDDEWVEPEMHSLWEYPAYPRSRVHTLMTFDLTSRIPSSPVREEGVMELMHPSRGGSSEGEVGAGGGGGGGGGDGRDRGGGGGGGGCNGVVLWMDYQLTQDISTTTGLIEPPGVNLKRRLCWDWHHKQAVHFLSPEYLAKSDTIAHKLNYVLEFDTVNGELRFKFQPS